MRRSGFFKRLFSSETPPCSNHWKSVKSPPEKGRRVLVKNMNGDINVAHLDESLQNIDLWIVFKIEINAQEYKFNVIEPLEWKEIPV